MRRTPHRKYTRLFCPVVECECGNKQLALSEFRISCHYLVFDKPIRMMGKETGNFCNDGTFVILAGECECGLQHVQELTLDQLRQLLDEHGLMVKEPEEDDILLEEVTEFTH